VERLRLLLTQKAEHLTARYENWVMYLGFINPKPTIESLLFLTV